MCDVLLFAPIHTVHSADIFTLFLFTGRVLITYTLTFRDNLENANLQKVAWVGDLLAEATPLHLTTAISAQPNGAERRKGLN